MICHSTEHVSTASVSSGGMLYTTPSHEWHCAAAWTCQKALGAEFCADLNARGGLELQTPIKSAGH